MNDEKMVTSLENQEDADGRDPIPSAHEAEDPSSLAVDDAPSDTLDRLESLDASLTAAQSAPETEEDRPGQDHIPFGDPLSDPASDPDAPAPLSAQEQLGVLQGELKQLREQLDAALVTRESLGRMTRELRELHALYPEVSLTELPDEVFEGMYMGIPPAAGYALYLKREREKQKEAERVNQANRLRSSGSLDGADADYLSPAEVRAMTPGEVRKNYHKIMQSMQKWH